MMAIGAAGGWVVEVQMSVSCLLEGVFVKFLSFSFCACAYVCICVFLKGTVLEESS